MTSAEMTDGAGPAGIKVGHRSRMAKGALFAMLANKFEGLLCVFDAPKADAIMRVIGAIDENSNACEMQIIPKMTTV